jgi:hypothetical protein
VLSTLIRPALDRVARAGYGPRTPMPPGDEPTDEDAPRDSLDLFDPFDQDDEEDVAAPAPSWLGAIGQMIAALLVVVAVVAFFIGAAAALRRLYPPW